MTLDDEELVRRFLLHVLPKGFMRIRHFGFLANRCRSQCLAQIRRAIEVDAAESADVEGTDEPTAFDGYPCPICHRGRLYIIARIAPQRRDGG
jgi:hypothetical protein